MFAILVLRRILTKQRGDHLTSPELVASSAVSTPVWPPQSGSEPPALPLPPAATAVFSAPARTGGWAAPDLLDGSAVQPSNPPSAAVSPVVSPGTTPAPSPPASPKLAAAAAPAAASSAAAAHVQDEEPEPEPVRRRASRTATTPMSERPRTRSTSNLKTRSTSIGRAQS